MKKLLLIFLFLLPSISYSQDRWAYMDSDDKHSLYYDTETILYYEKYLFVWVKMYYLDSKYKDYTITQYKITYDYRTLQIVNEVTYYFDGTLKSETPDTYPQSIIPDSIGEFIWQYFTKNE